MIYKDIKDMEVAKAIGQIDLVQQRVKDQIFKNIKETLVLQEGKLALIQLLLDKIIKINKLFLIERAQIDNLEITEDLL